MDQIASTHRMTTREQVVHRYMDGFRVTIRVRPGSLLTLRVLCRLAPPTVGSRRPGLGKRSSAAALPGTHLENITGS